MRQTLNSTTPLDTSTTHIHCIQVLTILLLYLLALPLLNNLVQ